jgi:hypothetical protein
MVSRKSSRNIFPPQRFGFELSYDDEEEDEEDEFSAIVNTENESTSSDEEAVPQPQAAGDGPPIVFARLHTTFWFRILL